MTPLGRHVAILVNVAFLGLLVGSERTVVPLLAEEAFGISSSTVTLSFIAGFGAAKALANLVAGRLSDRIGRRQVLLLGWAFGLAVPLLLGGARSWGWIVAANVLLGLNQGLAWTATLVAMGDLAGARRRGTAMGWNEFVGYVAIGVAAWQTGRLATTAGLGDAVLVLAGLAAVLGFASSLLVRETHAGERRRPRRTLAASRHDVACAVAGHVTKVIDAGIWGLVPLLLSDRGVPLAGIGLAAGIYPAVWGGAQVLTGAASDRLGRRRLITAGMVLQATGLAGLATLTGLPAAVAASAVTGAGAALVYPTLLAAVRDTAERDASGTALGEYRFWRDLGFVVGAIGGGLLADRIGIPGAVGTVALVALGAAVLVRTSVRDPVGVPVTP